MGQEGTTHHHEADENNWPMLRQWFKAIKGKIVALKEVIGCDLADLNIPREYYHCTYAVEDYIKTLHKLNDSLKDAVSKSRGTYCESATNTEPDTPHAWVGKK